MATRDYTDDGAEITPRPRTLTQSADTTADDPHKLTMVPPMQLFATFSAIRVSLYSDISRRQIVLIRI